MENNQIFFLLPNLKFGGAERVSINLASNLKERGFEVYFLLMSLEGEFLKEAKEEFIVLNLSCNRTYKLPFKLIYAFIGVNSLLNFSLIAVSTFPKMVDA